MVRICFVCLGNICRSPTAEGVMLQLVEQAGLEDRITVDSAGTSSYHEGEAPDARAQEAARARGLMLRSIARQLSPRDFDRFDYLVAMDKANWRSMERIAPHDAARAKIHLLRDFDTRGPRGKSVPDPYYGGPSGFDEVFAICEAACAGLLGHIRKNHLGS